MTTTAQKPAGVTEEGLHAAIGPVAKRNGPALAALLSSGIGTACLGLFTSLAEVNAGFKGLMDLDKNFGLSRGVGPLSGKTIYAVAIWLIAWAISAYVMRDRSYQVRPFVVATFVLIAIGLLGTFPVFYQSLPK